VIHLTRAPSIGLSSLLLLLAAQSVATAGPREQVNITPTPPETASVETSRVADPIFSLQRTESDVAIVNWDRQSITSMRESSRSFVVPTFPVSAKTNLALKLQPFSVMGKNTRVVLGRKGQPDVPFRYDTSRFSFFRGEVVGSPGSSVFLALGETGSTGYIDLGAGKARYRVASKNANGVQLAAGSFSVFSPSASMSSARPPSVPFCASDEAEENKALALLNPGTPKATVATSGASTVGVKHMELAIDTDYDYFSLFGDVTAATDYVFLAYGEVSSIFQRDVDVRIEVVFVRIWTDPNDLFNGPDPLSEFTVEWDANMGAVARDAAQLFSGRRDMPFGGQAFLSRLCDQFGFGITGYILGFLPDPTQPSVYTWDVSVTAHELGHTFGAPHTHGVGLDTCDDGNTTPQRGPIMSYCGQTWSGMNANTDNYFHTTIRGFINTHVNESACVELDCNLNNIDDATDIANATSADVNGNAIPDECEDCNKNGTLDPADIAGASNDLNGNGIPDECEPDCDSNGSPDDRDIALGASVDLYGNGVPDQCETDCNSNFISDYSEIQVNMPLDVNRNARLDSCEDCDNDGTNDATELASSHYLWVASGLSDSILREFHPVGVLSNVTTSTPNLIDGGQDVIVKDDGHVLASSGGQDRVLEFDADGVFLGDLVSSGSGGLDFPTGMLISKTGTLLVSSMLTDQVLEYNATTGAVVGTFVAAGSGGLVGPFGLVYGPNGNLFVCSATNEVLEYDGSTGSFVQAFVRASRNGGLDQPKGLAFKPDGNLLVASFGTDEVLEYDGRRGRPLGKWAQVGTVDRITQDSPWGIRISPDRHVYVTRTGTDFSSSPLASRDDVAFSHLTDARMFEFDGCTGWFRRTVIGGNDHGLDFASGFAFVPGNANDCNFNQLQDDCDIASGFSTDMNNNAIPDECEVDCDGNGTPDAQEFFPIGSRLDCNCNGQLDSCDLAQSLSIDCNNNNIPDECEDCNGDGIADECEITAGAPDCNANGLPDECESAADCDGNLIADICDLGAGAPDCNGNETLDVCDVASATTLLSTDFEAGLPAGWSTSGAFEATTVCAVSPVCDGTQWMRAGDSGVCTYSDNQVGVLAAPVTSLPPGLVTLNFCSMVDTELGFDFVGVYVNDTLVWQQSGQTAAWQDESVDLTVFANQDVQIEFRFASDGFVSGPGGWEVDNISLTFAPVSEDCDGNLVPDECQPDSDGNGIIDACDVVALPVETVVGGDLQRNLSFVVPTSGAGQDTALQVTLTSLYQPGSPLPINPPDLSAREGEVRYVNRLIDVNGQPTTTCLDSAAFSTFYRCATLGCNPEYFDWAGALGGETLRLSGAAIVPDSTYSVSQLPSTCMGNEIGCPGASAAVSLGTSRHGDTNGDLLTNVTDVVGSVDCVKDVFGAPPEYRCYVRTESPQPQLEATNVTDIVIHVDAVKLVPYQLTIPACP
jgi:Metallo-peptidase family M12